MNICLVSIRPLNRSSNDDGSSQSRPRPSSLSSLIELLVKGWSIAVESRAHDLA